jgi:hypothetical protein
MRPIWKTVLRLAVDATATIGFFYLAIEPSAIATGAAVASVVVFSDFFWGIMGHARSGATSFVSTTFLVAWMSIYVLFIFAAVMEVMRRLLRQEKLSTYLASAALGVPIALLLAGYFGPLRPGAEGFAGTDAIVIVVLALAGAVGGTAYWLITVKLRAILTHFFRRLLCGVEPRATSCAFS